MLSCPFTSARLVLCTAAPLLLVMASSLRAADVAVTVNSVPIYVQEIDAELARTLSAMKADEKPGAALRAAMLKQIVDQQLVLGYLEKSSQAIPDALVEKAMVALKRRLAEQKIPFDKHLKKIGMPEDALRRQLKWRYSWQQFVNKRVTEKALQEYFDEHRADHDGRQVRYSQVLLKLDRPDEKTAVSPEQIEQALAKAKQIREKIDAGQLAFADAAKQFSKSPTANNGGDQGSITRRGEVPEEIAAAVFALKVGETSKPILTPFGVHLLHVTEIKPGENKLNSVRAEVRRAVIQQGFSKVANYQRERGKIDYTGAMPHFDSKTGKLIDK